MLQIAKQRRYFILLIVFLLALLLTGGLIMKNSPNNANETSPNFDGQKFVNSDKPYETDMANIWEIAKAYFKNERSAATPSSDIPVNTVEKLSLEELDSDTLYRLSHSTILMKLDGEFILTDPVFSDRASPVQWMGPKRFHQNPIAIENLPAIKAVVISHDHYDHLDKHSIKALKDKVEYFVVPLRVGEHLINWGVDKNKIIEKDWWQSFKIGSITLTATPTQHFSGRGLFDRDKTLWASWVIESAQKKIFFGGDSGYFSGFKEIGDRFGPFDITLIEVGAYNNLWESIHMLPEQGVQAHQDLRGKYLLPIHNSTFDLALHDWFEPLEKAQQLAKIQNVNLLTPVFGEAISIDAPDTTRAWWKAFTTDQYAFFNFELDVKAER